MGDRYPGKDDKNQGKNDMNPGKDKKRGLDQYQRMQQVTVMQVGQTFRSKADFHGYWSQCLKVSA